MASASLPPFIIKISLSSCILSLDAKSYFFFINAKTIGRCLLRAGPKLLEAFFTFSIADINRALLDDFKHFYSNVIFVLTRLAITELSSTISFGSNSKL